MTVTVLHGVPRPLADARAAINFIEGYAGLEDSGQAPAKYEIEVRYSNGDAIHGVFQSKSDAVTFLRGYI